MGVVVIRDKEWAEADDLDDIDDLITSIADLVTDSSDRAPAQSIRPARRTVPAVPCYACQKPITGELWVQPDHKVDLRGVNVYGDEITYWEWQPTYFCEGCAHIPIPPDGYTIARGGQGAPCDWCGRTFHARAHWRLYCTPACRQAYASRVYYEQHRQVLPTARACEMCGASFTPKRSDARTCSNACRQRAYRQRGGAQ